jgi:O-antigen ligase
LPFAFSAFVMLAYYLVSYTLIKSNTSPQNDPLGDIKAPLIILLLWVCYPLIQIIPMPIELISALSPASIISAVNTGNRTATLSIAPNITLIEIIKNASYIAVFIVSLVLLNSKKRLIQLTDVLFFTSAIIALYSLINHFTNGSLDLVPSIPPWTASWEQAAHGTFSYQNHYASFLTLTIPLGCGLLYANIKQQGTAGISKNNATKLIDTLMSVNGLYLMSLIIMIIALFKTASRGGNAVFIISLAITYLIVLIWKNTSIKQKLKKVFYLASLVTIVGIVLVFIGIADSLSQRLEKDGIDPHGRDLMHQTSFAIIKDYPVFGSGAGTYPVLQQSYKSPNLGYTAMSKRAHNEYLELLSNQGIIGFSLLGIATLLLYSRLLQGLKKSRNENATSLYGLQVASFCSVTAILIHSLADFNFHLPTNTVYFFVILAIGLKARMLKGR